MKGILNRSIWRRGSSISAQAAGVGKGGNLELNSPAIVGLENSDIIANTLQGQRGHIQITTQVLLDLENRDRLAPSSDIKASSQWGTSGTVQIKTIEVDPSSGLILLPPEVIAPSQLLAIGCLPSDRSQYSVTGPGGIPQNPIPETRSNRSWQDVQNLSLSRRSTGATMNPPNSSHSIEFEPATG